MGAPRVLVVHSRYSSRVPSGENLVVDQQADGLERRGVAVERLEASNDDVIGASFLEKAAAAPRAVWSGRSAARLRTLVSTFDPTVIHIHNTLPLLSPSVVRAAIGSGRPVMWTAHNYRLGCISGNHRYEGSPCVACRSTAHLAGVWRGCYAGGRAASATATAATAVLRPLVRRATTLAISQHVRDWLVDEHRFVPERVHVLVNGIPDPAASTPVQPSSSRDVVLAARLDRDKGIELALDAWAARSVVGGRLLVAGSGPLQDLVAKRASADESIVALGLLAPDELATELAAARVALVPPTWAEPFGRTAVEALALGRPVVATELGALPEIVDDSVGRLVPPDPGSVAAALDELAADDALVDRLGAAGRHRWRTCFDLEVTLDRLLEVYDDLGAPRAGPTQADII